MGKRHGQGVYNYSDGGRYEGTWVDDRIEGTGTSYYANKNVYEGQVDVETSSRFIVSTVLFVISIWNFTLHFSMQWQDGRITGEGTLTYADGDRFFAFFNLLMFAT